MPFNRHDFPRLYGCCSDKFPVYRTDRGHFAEGGLGTIVTEVVSNMKEVTVRSLGLPHEYAITCGSYEKLLEYYKLGAKGIAASVKEFLHPQSVGPT